MLALALGSFPRQLVTAVGKRLFFFKKNLYICSDLKAERLFVLEEKKIKFLLRFPVSK